MYVGRSDNVLNQRFHITPRQLYTLFSQKLEEVQGPPQEEKQVSLNYEPPFNENPSDNEIIEALIKYLEEQDGFLTAIDCVSTKAILSWLEKQKEQKPAAWSEEDEKMVRFYEDDYNNNIGNMPMCDVIETRIKFKDWLLNRLKALRPQPKPKWSEEDEAMIKSILWVLESYVSKAECELSPSLTATYPTYYKEIDWLKSLRPDSYKNCNSRWKPSEEQMKALKKVTGNAVDADEYYPALATLYYELKEQF